MSKTGHNSHKAAAKRYGEDAWKKAVERSKKTGRLPWSDPA